MQPRHQATLTQPLPCVSQHHVANLHVSTHITTPDDNSHAAIPMRSATGDSKTPYNYAHTSTPKAASSHRCTAAKKNDKPIAAAPVAHARYLSSSPAATLHGQTQGFVLRLPPQTHSPCNIMQLLQCGSQHQLANLHLSTHRTRPEQQMRRVMQPFQCDLQPEIPKHPITTHTQAHPKQLQATVTLRQKKRQTDRSRTRRTHEVPFIVACSHFTRKNTRFRAPASSPKHSPCNIMQPLQCGSQHQLANLHLSTHRTRPEQQMTRVMQPFQCDLQPEIPKHPHTSTPKAASSDRYTAAKKNRQTDRSRPRRTHEVPFIVACSHFTRKNTRFRAPASSPKLESRRRRTKGSVVGEEWCQNAAPLR